MRVGRWTIGGWCVVGLLTSAGALAQSVNPSFQYYSTDQGLPNDQVTSILKDRRGFMWFGTVNGLARFDGLRFTVFKRNGRSGLLGNYIIGLTLDSTGRIWIATHRGLNRFDPAVDTTETGRFETIPLPTQRDRQSDNDYVSKLVFDRAGNGWFATTAELYRVSPATGQRTAFPLPQPLPTPYLSDLYIDRRGRFWLLRGGMLYRFDPTTGQYTYRLERKLAVNGVSAQVMSLYEDRSGQLWAATLGNGLMRYDSARDQFTACPDSPRQVSSILEDWRPEDGNRSFFWLANAERLDRPSLYTYNPTDGRTVALTHDVRNPLSVQHALVGTVFRDPQTGVVWFGTDRGVGKIDPFAHKFTRKFLPVSRDRTSLPISVVCPDRRDSMRYWVGMADGSLYRWNCRTDQFTSVAQPDRWDVHHSYGLIQDRRGHLWLAGGSGVWVYDPEKKRWRRWTIGPKTAIHTLYEDRAGRIWLGGFRGDVYVLDPTTETIRPWALTGTGRTNQPGRDSPGRDSLGHTGLGRISRFREDPQGRVWVATAKGLFRLDVPRGRTDPIRLHPTSAVIQPSDQLQNTFYIDPAGRLWASGIGFLAQADLNGRIRKTYTIDNGLRSDHIFDIREDRTGKLWLATDNLLHRLDPTTGQFRYYGKDNGLFSNFVFGTITRNSSGELFIGAMDGFIQFRPEQLQFNRVPPPVAITGVRVGNVRQPFAPGRTIVVPPSANVINLEFAALNYSQPEKNRYAYRLIGFDSDWVASDDRTATYTNLAPGDYTFRVKAANNDGVWNERGESVTIRVVPAYWQTGWFRLLVGLLVVGALYAIYRYREGQRRRLEAIRNRIATDLHDDMGSTLSSIRIFSDVVQQQIAPVRPEAVPVLQRISTSATTLSESMQDIIWTIQTKNDTLADVVTRMREFGLRMAEARQIDLRMRIEDEFLTIRLNVEQRRNVYLIFKESLNNAVKYADCSQINVCLNVVGKQLRMVIADNGRGFDPATVRPGNGLPNLEKRAREIRGKLTITSAPGQGTKIELLMKV